MRPRSARTLFFALALLLPAATTTAQAPDDALTPYRTEVPPVIDGILDDVTWQRAPNETGFRTWRPDFGGEMSEQTVVWYAYDRDNLYFAFRCYDSEPHLVKRSVSARDQVYADDWICINLDSFGDQQSLYAFYVNPRGIQADSRATVVNEDRSVDMVWYSGGRVDEEGWTAEVRIPFKSIRYTNNDPVRMGVIFERNISRSSEGGTYPALDPARGASIPAWLTQMRPLTFSGIRTYRLVEFIPAVTWSGQSAIDAGELASEGGVSTLSLTGKLGITSNLVLDATANPDFSQIEADAGQVDFNQRYALFYPEKRPFFLEGREDFIFGGLSAGDPLGAVVHTRSINDPTVGVKLAGKIGERNTIASIYAEDHLPAGSSRGDRAWFSILRYKRALTEDSFLGGFLTSRERMFGGRNRLLGMDGQLRLSQAAILGFHGFLSQSRAEAEAGLPDPATTDGHAVGIGYTFDNRDWYIDLRANDLSEDFDTETGYLRRAGMTRLRSGFLRKVYPGSETILRLDHLVHLIGVRDHSSGLWEHLAAYDLRLVLPRSTTLQLGFRSSTEVFLGERFQTSSAGARASSQLTRRLGGHITLNMGNRVRYEAVPFQARGLDASVGIGYEPTEHLSTSLSWTYSDLFRDEDDEKVFDYTILRSRNTYQVNRFLFFRAIVEYNDFNEELQTEFLASFTYIPGTVIHLGYGSLYDRIRWDDGLMDYVSADRFLETRRGIFFKTSFLWRQ